MFNKCYWVINSSADSEKVAKDVFAYQYKLLCILFIYADDSVGGSQGINLKKGPLSCCVTLGKCAFVSLL